MALDGVSKRVYKFTKAEHAIGTLQKKRLKLTTIDELNDPFDLHGVDVTDQTFLSRLDSFTQHFKKANAILCFSRNWDNLLLWSHYGDSHKGICLGFDIPDSVPGKNYDTDVRYQPNVVERPEKMNDDFVERLLRTKHESWSYEQEVRIFFRLNDPPDAKGLTGSNSDHTFCSRKSLSVHSAIPS